MSLNVTFLFIASISLNYKQNVIEGHHVLTFHLFAVINCTYGVNFFKMNIFQHQPLWNSYINHQLILSCLAWHTIWEKKIKGQKIDNVELYLMRAKKNCKNIFISDFFPFPFNHVFLNCMKCSFFVTFY